MFKNKLLSVMLIILVALTLIAVVTLVVVMTITKEDTRETKKLSIDKVIEQSVDIEEITTNLSDDSFIVIQLKIVTDNKKAKEELAKRNFQVKNILIQELASMESKQFSSKQGLIEVENKLKVRINELMQEGKVEQVYITNRVIQ